MRVFYQTICLLAICLISVRCSVKNTTIDSGLKGLYDFESTYLHPEFLAYHVDDQLTDIHYKIDASEILFSRESTTEPFRSNVQIKYEIYKPAGDTIIVLSSGTTKVSQAFDGSVNYGVLLGKFSVELEAENQATLKIVVRDNNRGTSVSTLMTLDKSSIYVRQNFLPTDNEGIPLFRYQVVGGHEAIVRCDRCLANDLKIYRNSDEIKLPPPPFSDSRLEFPSHQSGLNMDLPMQDKQIELNLTKGFYFITQAEDESAGLTLTVQDTYFPEVAEYNVMAESLRYITSRTEYENITTGHNERKRIEEFWIECGGDKDHARELIRTYYRRIQEANLYFSHIAPGWKTDRGLVHTVFGNPKKIYRSPSNPDWNTPETEVWLYGEEDNINSLTFTFRKVDSPYTDKHFVLNRDHVYKTDWERAVTSWRNGRIYTE
jgi:GWxTD domain-containing protein